MYEFAWRLDEQNEPEAAKWMYLASLSAHRGAGVVWGYWRIEGRHIEKNVSFGVRLLEGIRKDDPTSKGPYAIEATKVLVKIYAFGKDDIEPDWPRARSYIQLLADAGLPEYKKLLSEADDERPD